MVDPTIYLPGMDCDSSVASDSDLAQCTLSQTHRVAGTTRCPVVSEHVDDQEGNADQSEESVDTTTVVSKSSTRSWIE